MSVKHSRSPWWTVLCAVLGLMVGNGPVLQFTFGVFVKPVAASLGIERGTVSTALLAGLLLTAISTPIVGWLVDRFGIRRVGLPLIVLFGCGVAAIGLGTASALGFIVLYGITGLMAGGQTPTPYAKAIAATFDRRRGLALGIAMAGVGLGTAFVPLLAELLVQHVGWRGAYVGLGVLTVVIALPAMYWLLDRETLIKQRRGTHALAIEGMTRQQAFRSKAFWKLTFIFFAVACAANGTIAHIVPLMTDRGVAPDVAASLLSFAGLALIAGRVLAGYAMDRLFAPYIAAVFFALPLTGLLLLLLVPGTPAAIASVILIGMGLGAEVDMIAFLLSRYLGLKKFGELYGYLFAVFMVGSGIGPFLMGQGFQHFGSYRPPMILFCALLIGACLVVLRLGAYVYEASERREPTHEAASPGARVAT